MTTTIVMSTGLLFFTKKTAILEQRSIFPAVTLAIIIAAPILVLTAIVPRQAASIGFSLMAAAVKIDKSDTTRNRLGGIYKSIFTAALWVLSISTHNISGASSLAIFYLFLHPALLTAFSIFSFAIIFLFYFMGNDALEHSAIRRVIFYFTNEARDTGKMRFFYILIFTSVFGIIFIFTKSKYIKSYNCISIIIILSVCLLGYLMICTEFIRLASFPFLLALSISVSLLSPLRNRTLVTGRAKARGVRILR